MYIIQEIQQMADGTISMLPAVMKESKNAAESEFYIKVGYAAISELPCHAVAMYTHDGTPIMHKAYFHGDPVVVPVGG